MRKLFVVLAIIFSSLGVVFSVLPFDTLALLPIGLSIVFALLAYSKSDGFQKKLPKWLVMAAVICIVFVLGKTYLIKDEVALDTQFEKDKIETKKEAQKDLEDLEGLE
jgi:heme/copper-type cytochrome/quinol oxidase subunit 3